MTTTLDALENKSHEANFVFTLNSHPVTIETRRYGSRHRYGNGSYDTFYPGTGRALCSYCGCGQF
jgi:hypothetical protein